jgi:hypothetical protein
VLNPNTLFTKLIGLRSISIGIFTPENPNLEPKIMVLFLLNTKLWGFEVFNGGHFFFANLKVKEAKSSLVNKIFGFSIAKSIRKSCFPTFPQKCRQQSTFVKMGLVYTSLYHYSIHTHTHKSVLRPFPMSK